MRQRLGLTSTVDWAVRVLVCAALYSFATPAGATPAALFGAGPESQAQAGTGTSYAQGYASSYINPAGLARNPKRSFAFGVHATRLLLEVEPGPNDAHHDATQAVLFGVTAPLPFPEPIADRLVLGLGVSSPGAAIARVRILNETRAQFPLLGPRADALNFNLGLGIRLPWGLQLGVGTGLLASLQGSIALDSGAEAARSVTDDELVLTSAPVLGLEYAVNDALYLGLVLRAALQSAFNLDVTVQNLGDLVVPPLHVTGLAGFDPAELNLEASQHLGSWRLTAALGHKFWGELETLREPTVSCPSEQSCAALGPHTLHLHDTWVPRLALQRVIPVNPSSTLELRAGYFFEPSPLPAQTGEARVFDNPRHTFSAGYGLAFERPVKGLELQFAAQWHHLVPRQHELTFEGAARRGLTQGEILSVCWTLGGEF